MYVHTTEISKGSTIHFDTIVTNIGNHYNKHSGIFTAPQHGVYVFAWNLYCDGYIYSQLVVNSNVVGAMFSSAEGASNIRTPTGIVVVEVNQGDIAYVRIHPTGNHSGNLNSHPNWRSSFNARNCTKINEINYLQLKSNVIAVFGVIGLFRFMYIIFMMRLLSKNSIIQLKLAFPNLKKDSHCIHFSYIDKTCLHPVLK